MKVTENWLKTFRTDCDEWDEGIKWWEQHKHLQDTEILALLIKENNFEWANWFITRRLNRINKVKYAVFAAESILFLFEKECLKDNRVRRAIEEAKAVVTSNTKKNRDVAYTAARSANAANAAACAANAANHKEIKTNILNYGLALLK